ncbi:lysoplasmalogenase [Ornithinimicrobium sp. F0845]|uniref:lysoplasmalogenase n=1 Tax=Ornithinimicrobium sp. F0845 TaxID=2926412 RepID=UPI001FF2B3F3|nr:lysoplasmalogenase [Ornithinimicrobium sp. F0845]MCK0111028.1 lysoplasmalogenase [Ornithinimicrobium sp. F0845]
MPPRRPVQITAGLFGCVAAVHLTAQLLGLDGLAAVTQVLLMPLLAAALLTATDRPRSRLVRLTLLALGFSWLGDTAPRLADGDPAFLLMVGFFLIAQVVYIVAFWPWRPDSLLARRRVLLVPYVVAVAALVVACAPHAGVLLVPVLIYGLLLGSMAVLATGVNRSVWIGGALFLVSDGLIALNAFAPWWSLPQQGFWVMLTYIAAQALIVRGVLRTLEAQEHLSRDYSSITR